MKIKAVPAMVIFASLVLSLLFPCLASAQTEVDSGVPWFGFIPFVLTGGLSGDKAPGAVFSYEADETNILEIHFDASASTDPDGTIESYEWDFGDGDSGTGEKVSHTYGETGDYEVTLTVTDDGGLQDTSSFSSIRTTPIPTDLYVDASVVGDGIGSEQTPYRTITAAVDRAGGDSAEQTIHVRGGTYDYASGEDSSIPLEDLTLQGEGDPGDVGVDVSLICRSNCTIKDLSCNSEIEVASRAEDVVLDNLNLAPSSEYFGVTIRGDNVQLKQATIEGRQVGIFVSQNASEVKVQSNSVEVTETGSVGIQVAYNASATVSGNELKNCPLGLEVTGQVNVEALDNDFSGCDTGVRAEGNASLNLENNRIKNGDIGVLVTDSATADLGGGILESNGGNIFDNGSYNLKDLRDRAVGVIYATGNTWNDPQPSGTVQGPADDPPNYYIEEMDNEIVFSE